MSKYDCRAYRSGDFPRLCEIHDKARMDELRRSNLEAAFLPLTVAAEKEELFKYRLVVAEQSGRIDGFAAFTSDEIGWLYVLPARQRSGIGTLLMHHIFNNAGPILSTEVLAENEPALSFYESLGFRNVRTLSGAMPGNEQYQVKVHELKYDKRPPPN